MKTDGVFGGPITQALITGRSLRVRWSRNRRTITGCLLEIAQLLEKKRSKIRLERV
jgi:hypothetical protein